jgi:hypothetical protein
MTLHGSSWLLMTPHGRDVQATMAATLEAQLEGHMARMVEASVPHLLRCGGGRLGGLWGEGTRGEGPGAEATGLG